MATLRDAAEALVTDEVVRLHDHVAAVSSSMAFGFSLFLPFRVAGPEPLAERMSRVLSESAGEGAGYEAAHRAERLIIWVLAPEVHPLVLSRDDSPLRWLNEGLRGGGLEMRGLPIDVGRQGDVAWLAGDVWPR